MNKSMYSLMLMDEVIEAIDKLAYLNHTNRSNMINQILAEYVSLTTPEMRMQEIFDQMVSLLKGDEALQVQSNPNTTVLSIKSALSYKYRPTIRYAVELYRVPDGTMGELRVTFRTQSNNLLMEMTHFLNVWIQLEYHYIHHLFAQGSIQYDIAEGRFKRTFMLPVSERHQNNETLSQTIAAYIQMFDEILKGYLSGIYQTDSDIEERYVQYLNSGMVII
jgi:hypothetical protein